MVNDVRYYEAVGRRKRAVARVRIYPGTGEVVINGKELKEYFGRPQDWGSVLAPFELTNNEGRFNLSILVQGGGVTGQAEAIRHGVARALLTADPNAKAVLRNAGFLTRDQREKERKKAGLKRARKAPQYTKR
ncbi:MAG: 30S ribosomal protein S9 [Anaerolineae bacterium]|nr:30S ribosomal protein S9 [Anaerolineae bacterium]